MPPLHPLRVGRCSPVEMHRFLPSFSLGTATVSAFSPYREQLLRYHNLIHRASVPERRWHRYGRHCRHCAHYRLLHRDSQVAQGAPTVRPTTFLRFEMVQPSLPLIGRENRPESESWIDVLQLYLVNTGAYFPAFRDPWCGAVADPCGTLGVATG